LTPFYHSLAPEALYANEVDQLLALGWYRMHQTIFTCSHIEHDEQLFRVHWLRFACADIKDTATHRRIRKRNQNFHHTFDEATTISPGHRALHARYRAAINFDGAFSIEECLFGDEDESKSIFITHCLSIYDGDRLIAAGYFDVGTRAAASILHFFDPQYARYSLGKYLILLTIDYLNAHGFAFYYPGYVVASLPKMDYKLFLGREHAYYFDPETVAWKLFDEKILLQPPL
jgi:arginine-tRNA-protein transferase